MFLMPTNLNLTEKDTVTCGGTTTIIETTLHGRIAAKFKRDGWECKYVTPTCEHPHILTTDTRFGGYAIGTLAYKVQDGFILCRLENPAGKGMTEWEIPYRGLLTSDIIIKAINDCIDVFENEDIPEPQDGEEE